MAHSVGMRRLASLIVLLAVASCVSEPAPKPAPRPTARYIPPAPAAAPAPVSADWRDWPVTPGDWVYRRDARGSIALFGGVGRDALLTLRCDRERGTLYLSRSGSAAAPIVIRTTTLARTLPTQPTGGEQAYVAVALTPRDPLLDAMAFSRGRFIVEQAGAPTLVIPAWAEVPRVTEDCR